jgi:hypothetical protein
MILKFGISGKRLIHSQEREHVYTSIKSVITTILKDNNVTQFMGYTSLAAGADTIFAEVVQNEFKQPLHIVLPFPIEELRNDFTDKCEQEVFDDFVLRHGVGQLVQELVPVDDEMRKLAYYQAGKEITDNCDEMIIVWDGLKADGQGGTAEILGYRSERKTAGRIHLIEVKPYVQDLLHDEIMEEFNNSDRLALDNRNRYRRRLRRAIVWGWLAVLCFTITIAFHHEGLYEFILTATELLLVSAVFTLYIQARRTNYHAGYLSERLRAEKLRMLLFCYHSDMHLIVSDDTIENDERIANIAGKIDQHSRSAAYRSKWYAQYAIKSLLRKQLDYHEDKITKIGNIAHTMELLSLITGWAFFINLCLHFVSVSVRYLPGHLIFHYPHEPYIFLSIILTATYAAIEGFIHLNEWAIMKKYSESAIDSLKKGFKMLPDNIEKMSDQECYIEHFKVCNFINTVMLNVNNNWSVIIEENNSCHLII